MVLSVAFSTMQLTGFGLLVAFYACEITYNIVSDRMRKNKQFEASDEGYTHVVWARPFYPNNLTMTIYGWKIRDLIIDD